MTTRMVAALVAMAMTAACSAPQAEAPQAPRPQQAVFERMEPAYRENRELTQFRAWLLPLLMNGQVRVA